jgi:hypothetical protein
MDTAKEVRTYGTPGEHALFKEIYGKDAGDGGMGNRSSRRCVGGGGEGFAAKGEGFPSK